MVYQALTLTAAMFRPCRSCSDSPTKCSFWTVSGISHLYLEREAASHANTWDRGEGRTLAVTEGPFTPRWLPRSSLDRRWLSISPTVRGNPHAQEHVGGQRKSNSHYGKQKSWCQAWWEPGSPCMQWHRCACPAGRAWSWTRPPSVSTQRFTRRCRTQADATHGCWCLAPAKQPPGAPNAAWKGMVPAQLSTSVAAGIEKYF